MFDQLFEVGFRRDARRYATRDESLAGPVGVVALVAEQLLRSRQPGEHQGGALVIAHLAFAEQHDDGASLAIAHGVQSLDHFPRSEPQPIPPG